MAMVDNRQQSQLSGMGYDPLRYPPQQSTQPHFTNPWVSAASQPQMYSTSIASNPAPEYKYDTPGQRQQPPANISIPPYHGLSVTAPPLGSDLMSRSYTGGYVSSAASNATTYAPTSAPYSQLNYGDATRNSYSYQQDAARRSSNPSVPSALFEDSLETQRQRQSSLVDFSRMTAHHQHRNSYSDAIDASRGILSLSNSDITPRNIYGTQSNRSSTDSYGFPPTHSPHSSISSQSYNGQSYYGADGSVTDYSSASESVDLTTSRTLPRPSALMPPSLPPAPQSMMGQFSSKVSSSSQKKHKCKICDKRFTRPSSLQTHMYSHTGEKPFACEVEGCGRHFSVVSNLRRHRKVHKNDNPNDHPSPDDA